MNYNDNFDQYIRKLDYHCELHIINIINILNNEIHHFLLVEQGQSNSKNLQLIHL